MTTLTTTPGLFDEELCLQRLSKLGDQLEKITAAVDFEQFRPLLNELFPRADRAKGGRPPYDVVMMFKILLLQKWYELSDGAAELQITDRLSFHRFLGLGLADRVPDENTIWNYRNALLPDAKDGAERIPTDGALRLFTWFEEQLEQRGLVTHCGSIIDATFVEVPRQRNTREENEQIKNGEVPAEWQKPENTAKLAQKDVDARWTKKNDENFYGYKDHTKVDRGSKLITKYDVTSASVHDSQKMVELLDEDDEDAWLDSGYVGKELAQAALEKCPRLRLHIIEKATRGHPLTAEQKANNREKSRVRVRVEHVFGQMTNAMGGIVLRTIGFARARVGIGLKNLAYDIWRYSYLMRTPTTAGVSGT